MNHDIPVPRYNYTDYVQWKEDWELIGGYPFAIVSPVVKYCYTKGKLAYQVSSQLEKFDRKNIHLFTLLDWIVDNETVVRPDVMIVCGELKNGLLRISAGTSC